MLNNEWGLTKYPFVPGHEVIGTIAAVGAHVGELRAGQRVGLGWYSHSCGVCAPCVSGDQNLCYTAEQTIVGRHGGFADRVRAHHEWVMPLPEALDAAKAGPLFCGGITVFNPIVQLDIHPTDRVGVIGIGGLGHLGLQFLHAWGCDVTAFTSSADKTKEAQELGADHVVNTREKDALKSLAGKFDFILVAANADLDWASYIHALRPRGRLQFVGVAPSPVATHIFPLIAGQKSISGSPLGSPATTAKMLDFAVRHKIEAVTELFPLEKVNEALERLRSGKVRYRAVLQMPA
jgi:uncharacterized zinc-type alcohol dehydrogenase-like protein